MKGGVTDGEGKPIAGVLVRLRKAGKRTKTKKAQEKRELGSTETDGRGVFEFLEIDWETTTKAWNCA